MWYSMSTGCNEGIEEYGGGSFRVTLELESTSQGHGKDNERCEGLLRG